MNRKIAYEFLSAVEAIGAEVNFMRSRLLDALKEADAETNIVTFPNRGDAA